jgi:hypothetical protein
MGAIVLDDDGVMRHQNDRKQMTRRRVLCSKKKMVPGSQKQAAKGDVTSNFKKVQK